MKTTMTKLRRTIRRVIKEQSGLGPIRISGAGSGSFSFVLGQNDFFHASSYDDDFEERMVAKLLQAQDQGYENVILGTDYLTIEEMIAMVRKIEADMTSE